MNFFTKTRMQSLPYDSALTISPNSQKPREGKARVIYLRGRKLSEEAADYAGAAEKLQEAHDLDPSNPFVSLDLTELYILLHKYAEAADLGNATLKRVETPGDVLILQFLLAVDAVLQSPDRSSEQLDAFNGYLKKYREQNPKAGKLNRTFEMMKTFLAHENSVSAENKRRILDLITNLEKPFSLSGHLNVMLEDKNKATPMLKAVLHGAAKQEEETANQEIDVKTGSFNFPALAGGDYLLELYKNDEKVYQQVVTVPLGKPLEISLPD